MFNFLENIISKPLEVKKRIAFLTAFAFAGFIFVIWLSVVYPDFKNDESAKTANDTKAESPIDTFSGALSEGFYSISSEFSKVKEIVGTIVPPAGVVSTTTASTTPNTSFSTTTTN